MPGVDVSSAMITTEPAVVRATAPAGWYEVGGGTRRWFDGRRWTEHYAPVLTPVLHDTQRSAKSSTNHGFHLIMTLMTLMIWLPVWAAVGVANSVRLRRTRQHSAQTRVVGAPVDSTGSSES